jgi:hypothetical protein
MRSKDYVVLGEKYTEHYSFSAKLLIPYYILDEYSEFGKYKVYKLSFPTQIMLTDGKKTITINIRVLGFGLSFYFRSNE